MRKNCARRHLYLIFRPVTSNIHGYIRSYTIKILYIRNYGYEYRIYNLTKNIYSISRPVYSNLRDRLSNMKNSIKMIIDIPAPIFDFTTPNIEYSGWLPKLVQTVFHHSRLGPDLVQTWSRSRYMAVQIPESGREVRTCRPDFGLVQTSFSQKPSQFFWQSCPAA